jgi:hypothetical protein
MFQKKIVEKTKTHILCSIIFFLENLAVYDSVEICGRAGQATHDNMANAFCMLHD